MPRITLRTALPFLAGGLLSLLGPVPAKEASASYLVIPSPEVAEASAAYKYANMTESEALAELDKRKVPYKLADPIPGVITPVRLTGKLHGVWIHSSIPESQRATSMYEVLDARLALALDDFAKILERHDIEEVVHYSLYRPNVPREDHGLKDGLHAGHGHKGESATKVASADAKAGTTAHAKADGKAGTAAAATAGASAAGAKPGAAAGALEAAGKVSAGAKPGAAGKPGASVPGVGAVASKASPGQKPASAGKAAGTPSAGTKPAGTPSAGTKPAPKPAGPGKGSAALPKLPAAGKALPSPGAKGSAAPSGAKQKTPAPGAAEKPAPGKVAGAEKPAAAKVAQAAAPGAKRAERGQAAASKPGAKAAGSAGAATAAKASVSKAGAGGAPAAVSASKAAPGGAAAAGSKAAPGAKPGVVTAGAVTGAGAKSGATTTASVAGTRAGGATVAAASKGSVAAGTAPAPASAATTASTKPVTRQTWAPPGTRHPAGLAIDVAMLKKRDGQWISVARHFQGKIGAKTCGDGVRTADTPEARELRSIVCEANDLGVFTYVLTPNFNAAHFDHFHMEIRPTVKWFLYH